VRQSAQPSFFALSTPNTGAPAACGYCRITGIPFRNVNRCPGWFAIATSIAACQRLVPRIDRRSLYADRRNFYKVEKWSRGVKAADMKIIVAAAVLSISLCGCSAFNDRSIYRNPVSPTVIGDGNSVLVSNAQNEAEGQELAEQHCKRFGKSARFNRMEGVRAFFDCQSPS
jgi:hypothetical protein